MSDITLFPPDIPSEAGSEGIDTSSSQFINANEALQAFIPEDPQALGDMVKVGETDFANFDESGLITTQEVARYVRLYSSENNVNDHNHYLEVEVYGRPQ